MNHLWVGNLYPAFFFWRIDAGKILVQNDWILIFLKTLVNCIESLQEPFHSRWVSFRIDHVVIDTFGVTASFIFILGYFSLKIFKEIQYAHLFETDFIQHIHSEIHLRFFWSLMKWFRDGQRFFFILLEFSLLVLTNYALVGILMNSFSDSWKTKLTGERSSWLWLNSNRRSTPIRPSLRTFQRADPNRI